MFGTPTAIRSMMSIADAGSRYPQRFRIVCSAAEPLNPEAIRWFREHYGITVLDFYGLTESYPLCANYPFMEVREGSMGKPMPGWEVAILDEHERPVARGERHEPSEQLAEEIKAFVRDHHSAYAYPRVVEFVPDLPKTLTGKIRRIELRQAERPET